MKEQISTKKAPAAIGPYSQAIGHGDLVFISGQIPINPSTGQLAEGDIQVQTRQVMENLKALTEEAGLSMDEILKCSCFLKNMDDFAGFNEIYGEYFGETPPAREAVEVARLPKDVLIEISAICGR